MNQQPEDKRTQGNEKEVANVKPFKEVYISSSNTLLSLQEGSPYHENERMSTSGMKPSYSKGFRNSTFAGGIPYVSNVASYQPQLHANSLYDNDMMFYNDSSSQHSYYPNFDPYSHFRRDDYSHQRLSPHSSGLYESIMEPFNLSVDMSLPNLQDVMDTDLFTPSALSPSPNTVSSLGIGYQRNHYLDTSPVYSSGSHSFSPHDPTYYKTRQNHSQLTPRRSYSSVQFSPYDPLLSYQNQSFSSYMPETESSFPVTHQSVDHHRPVQSSTVRQYSSFNESMKHPRDVTPLDMPLSDEIIKAHRKSVGRIEWKTIRGRVWDMARDHNGCRVLQQLLNDASNRVVEELYREVRVNLTEMMTDAFGNYLFQKLLEILPTEKKLDLVNCVKDHIVSSSFNVHGTRSVQNIIVVGLIDE